MMPMFSDLLRQGGRAGSQGFAYGVYNTLFSLGLVLGPFAGGVLITNLTLPVTLYGHAALLAAVGVLCYVFVTQIKKKITDCRTKKQIVFEPPCPLCPMPVYLASTQLLYLLNIYIRCQGNFLVKSSACPSKTIAFCPFGAGVRCRDPGGPFWNKAPGSPAKTSYRNVKVYIGAAIFHCKLLAQHLNI